MKIMNPVLQQILIDIDYVNRFKAMSEKFKFPVQKDWPIREYEEILDTFGYTYSYNKAHKFFKIDAIQKGPNKLCIHLALIRGMVEFILNMRVEDKGCGGPFPYMCVFLTDPPERPKNPRFGEKEDLRQVLETGFVIYEDIKRAFAERETDIGSEK